MKENTPNSTLDLEALHDRVMDRPRLGREIARLGEPSCLGVAAPTMVRLKIKGVLSRVTVLTQPCKIRCTRLCVVLLHVMTPPDCCPVAGARPLTTPWEGASTRCTA
jgi:hypothetical protein